jgi:hypothetical protein
MKTLAMVSLLLCAIPGGSRADKPKVNRAMIKGMEDSIDKQLRGIWPADPAEVMGLTQGTYINGYGVVFVSEVNVAPSTGISPFHPKITPEENLRTHDKKISRIPQLKAAMQEMLLSSASSLDSVPAAEQVALSITLFYWVGENTDGLPQQIVMHASKQALVKVKSGISDRSTLASALTVEEF